MEDFEKIKFKDEDKVRGYYFLLLTQEKVICLLDNEYLVPKSVLDELEKEDIAFNIIKNEEAKK